MLSVALFSSAENIKKLLFTASFGWGFKLFIPRQFSLLYSSPIPLSWGPSCALGGMGSRSPLLCLSVREQASFRDCPESASTGRRPPCEGLPQEAACAPF